eukprot:TRINITY_DN1721_c3_g1_i2.p1 TRINITY_DN1721_c3_g1~~TRINITY_DN1721_c3_g1_i2.p1  ORF type:complete len:712 (+),score=285.38 TRINITY_DN1721_c3_g1_i2:148-2283(+)
MALSHPKFNRDHQHGASDPEFPLMEPYPDKSWEDPAMKVPDGTATAPQSATVDGQCIEYHTSQQAGLNASLRNNILDPVELLEQKHLNNVELMGSIKRELLRRNSETVLKLQDYVSGLKLPPLSGFDAARLHQESGLEMPLDELQHSASRKLGNLTEVEMVIAAELTTRQPAKAREAEIYEMLRSTVQPVMDDARSSDALQQPADTTLGSSVLAASGSQPRPFDAAKCVLQGAYFLHTDHLSFVKAELADPQSVDRTKKLQQQARQCMRDREVAELSGDYAEVERQSTQAVRCLENLVEAQHDRLTKSSMSDTDVGSFLHELERWQREADEAFAATIAADRRRLEIIESDVRKLKEEGDARDERNMHAQSSFLRSVKEHYKQVEENTKRQDEAFRDALEILTQLPVLHKERVDLLTSVMDDVEAEKGRVAEYDNWWSLARSHEEEYQRASQAIEDGLRLTRSIHERFVRTVRQTMKERAVGEEHSKIQLKEATAMLSYFRDFTLTAGDLTDKKEKYLASLSSQLRQVELQLETAEETLDPDIQRHRHDREMIEQKMMKTRDDVSHLNARMARWAREFKKCEDVLTDLGVEFESPAVELMGLIAERERRLVGKRRDFVQKEQSALEEEQTKAKKLNSEARSAEAAFNQRCEDRRRSVSPALFKADDNDLAAVLPDQMVNRPRRVSAFSSSGRPATGPVRASLTGANARPATG